MRDHCAYRQLGVRADGQEPSEGDGILSGLVGYESSDVARWFPCHCDLVIAVPQLVIC